jgi:hypothetical protein
MVKGLDIFATHFGNFKDCYALIGGSACFLILSEVDLPARATKDLDIVLCIEEFNSEFAEAIWDFLNKGQYENWQTNAGEPHFFRYLGPEDDEYPVMLELFSRVPDALDIQDDSRYVRIPVDDEISSLSALIMNDDYYKLVQDGKIVVNDTSIVRAEYLIPLKIKAWIDLTDRKKSGVDINRDDINKHRSDVFRLSAVISPDVVIKLEDSVREDMNEGIKRLKANPDINLRPFGLRNTNVVEVIELLAKVYRLDE